jgi:hypothetical protein
MKRAIWRALLAVGLVLGLVTPSRAQEATLPSTPVEVAGWQFNRVDLGAWQLYYPPSLPPEIAMRSAEAIQIAVQRVPSRLGVAAPPAVFYILPSKADLDRALVEIGQQSARSISPSQNGRSVRTGSYPGVYYNGAGFRTVALALAGLGHEYTHAVQRTLARDRAIPDWFNEGLAEYFEAELPAEIDSEPPMRRLVQDGRAANEARQDSLPRISSLMTQAQWDQASATNTELPYITSRLAMEQLLLVSGPGSVVQVLNALGEGLPFEQAFAQVYGISFVAFEEIFQAYTTGPLQARFGSGLAVHAPRTTLSSRLQFVAIGLASGEAYTREYQGPGGCASAGNGTADQRGFASFIFTPTNPRCTGRWTLRLVGTQGTTATIEFEVVAPES